MVPQNNHNHLLLATLIILALLISFYVMPANATTCDQPYLGISAPKIEISVCNEYAVGYDYDLKTPLWVAYSLNRDNLKKLVKRKGSFKSDIRIPKKHRTYSSWYVRTGYDRGHIAPALDYRYSKKSEADTFVMSNVVPQRPGVNRGIWRTIEYRVRKHVKSVGDVIVISGPIYSSQIQKLKHKLAIPRAFYKIIIDQLPHKVISFIVPNIKPEKGYKLRNYVVSVDTIEKITGIDFLSNLPKTEQVRLELGSENASKLEWPVILK